MATTTARDLLAVFEAFTEADVDRLEHDFETLLGSLQKVQSGKDLFTVYRAFRAWCAYGRDIVREVTGEGTWQESGFPDTVRLGQAANDLLGKVTTGPRRWSLSSEEYIHWPGETVFHQYAEPWVTSNVFEYGWRWDEVYKSWNRASAVRALHELAATFFAAFRTVLQSSGGRLRSTYKTRALSIRGVQVRVRTSEGSIVKDVDANRLVHEIERAIRAMSKVAPILGRVRQGLKVELDLVSMPSRVTKTKYHDKVWGFYHSYEDYIQIFNREESSLATIVHELAHRFWFVYMSEDQQSEWRRVYDAGGLAYGFTDDQVMQVVRAFWQAYTTAEQQVRPWLKADPHLVRAGLIEKPKRRKGRGPRTPPLPPYPAFIRRVWQDVAHRIPDEWTRFLFTTYRDYRHAMGHPLGQVVSRSLLMAFSGKTGSDLETPDGRREEATYLIQKAAEAMRQDVFYSTDSYVTGYGRESASEAFAETCMVLAVRSNVEPNAQAVERVSPRLRAQFLKVIGHA